MEECLGTKFVCNGQLKDIAVFDASFLDKPHYIYEVFRVLEGVALFLEDHLLRFKQTCKLAGFETDYAVELLHTWVYSLIEANNMKMGNIKMVLNTFTSPPKLCLYMAEHQYPDARQFADGVDVVLFKATRHNPNAKIMDVDLRNNANETKAKKNVYETLLVDENNCITEGSRSNVFFIRGEKVISPPLEDVLPGITRKYIIGLCHELSLEYVEERVPARSLVVMEALFISGTSRKVLPVKNVDGLDFDPRHPIILKIMEGFNNKVEQYILSHKRTHS